MLNMKTFSLILLLLFMIAGCNFGDVPSESTTSNATTTEDTATSAETRAKLGLGTAALWNVGTSAGNLVQVDTDGALPTMNGSHLTNLSASALSGSVAIANGGTGATTAATAINNLLPSQTGNSGKFLTTNGSTASWGTASTSVDNSVSSGRLTVSSGTAVPTSDVTSASTIYYTPYTGNSIAVYDGVSSWSLITYSELSLSLSSLTSGANYDVFLYSSSGTATLELSAVWASDTARTDAISRQDGIWVKTSDKTRRYLGTFRTTSSTTTEDSNSKRYVWNVKNRVVRSMTTYDSSGGWSIPAVTSGRPMNSGSSAWKHQFVVGIVEEPVQSTLSIYVITTGAGFSISLNSDTADPNNIGSLAYTGSGNVEASSHPFFNGPPRLGYNYLQGLETNSTGSTTNAYPYGAGVGCNGLTICSKHGMSSRIVN